MRKGPYLLLYNQTNTERISSLDFGTVIPDSSSQDIIVWLWNMKDFSSAPKATDVRVSVIGCNSYSSEIVDSKLLSVNSNGVLDPDGTGIIDDAESEFYPIGDNLLDPDSYHLIGDIPSNCARKLTFRLTIPENFLEDLTSGGFTRLIVKIGFMSAPVKWLYASD
jgi:hypothetical protein